MSAYTLGSKHKELGHQNCKWPPILSILACFTGKTGELMNGCFFKRLVTKLETKSGVLTLAKSIPLMLNLVTYIVCYISLLFGV